MTDQNFSTYCFNRCFNSCYQQIISIIFESIVVYFWIPNLLAWPLGNQQSIHPLPRGTIIFITVCVWIITTISPPQRGKRIHILPRFQHLIGWLWPGCIQQQPTEYMRHINPLNVTSCLHFQAKNDKCASVGKLVECKTCVVMTHHWWASLWGSLNIRSSYGHPYGMWMVRQQFGELGQLCH